MKQFYLLAIFTAISLLSSCDYLMPDETSIPQGIMLTNKDGLEGTYIISGAHSYLEKTTKWLSTPIDGEYTASFCNTEVKKNVCYFDGKGPVFVGKTKFEVPSPNQTVSVPVEEISCMLSFKEGNGVKISKALVAGVPNYMFIDGQFGQPTTVTLYDKGYVIATKNMEVSISVDILDDSGRIKEMKVLETKINAQPGHRYILKVAANDISVSSN